MTFEVILKDTTILKNIFESLMKSHWMFMTGYVVLKSTGITTMYEINEELVFNLELTTDDSFYIKYNCSNEFVIQLFDVKDFCSILKNLDTNETLTIKYHDGKKLGQVVRGSCLCFNSHQKHIGQLQHTLIPSNLYHIGMSSIGQYRTLPVQTLNYISEYIGYLSVILNEDTLSLIDEYNDDFSISVIPSENKITFNFNSSQVTYDSNNGLKTFLPTNPSILNSFKATFPTFPVKPFERLIKYFPSNPMTICPFFYPDKSNTTPIYFILNLESRIRIRLFMISKQQTVFLSESAPQQPTFSLKSNNLQK